MTNLARIPVPFRWNVNDGLNGSSLIARTYSSEVAGVLTRTATKRVSDRNGVLVPLVQGVPPITWVAGAPALLLEAAGTNLAIRSEEFNDANWVKSGVTVTANAIAAPDRTLTADLLTSAGSGAAENLYLPITFTANDIKCVALYVRAGTATTSAIALRDNTAAVNRHVVTVTWTAGVPTLSTQSGAGRLFPVEALGTTGWYRILFNADGVVAANVNRLIIYPTGLGTVAGTMYAWGAQAENDRVPSSYIPTVGSTVTRAADSVYFPFTLPPTAMTIYVRGIEHAQFVATGLERRILRIGDSATAAGRVELSTDGSAGGSFRIRHHGPSHLIADVAPSPAPVRGNLTELRGVLRADGSMQGGVTVERGAETMTAATAANALSAAWANTRLYLSGGLADSNTDHAFTHVCVALGEQPLDIMRELAGV